MVSKNISKEQNRRVEPQLANGNNPTQWDLVENSLKKLRFQRFTLSFRNELHRD